jgi:peptidoglycan/xylan/chitin deacetylase (PgdA/CDA1 family)
MPLWKQLVLSLYYHGSYPLRAVRNDWLARAGRAPLMILMYHRVADDAANAWTTSNAVFARQIRWLQQHVDMLSLAELQQRVQSRRNDRPAVSITFDDGYAENCDHALPLLLEQKIPLTYFVTSNAVLGGSFFPHDLEMGNRLVPNTLAQLRDLAAAGVEIGGHTRTHANLGAIHDEATLWDEVVHATRDVEDAIGKQIRYFAFPFGQHANLNRHAFQIARDEGFEAVVSAYGGYNFPRDDAFHLQRMGVDGPMIRLKNWTTLDPCKQLLIPRYVYNHCSTVTQAGAVCG